jgi:hypothetical protein
VKSDFFSLSFNFYGIFVAKAHIKLGERIPRGGRGNPAEDQHDRKKSMLGVSATGIDPSIQRGLLRI